MESLVEPGRLFRDVAFANGRFAVAGAGGICETSVDGTTWTPHDTGTDLELLSLTSGKDMIVAVGQSGAILSSLDGSTWDRRLRATTTWLGDVAFGNGRFVIVGAEGTVLTSADGEALAQGSIRPGWWLHRVSYADGGFVCIGSDGSSFSSFTSADGLNWSGLNYISTYGGDSLTRILRWRGQFVVFVPERDTGYSSKDGITWTEIPGKVAFGRISDAAVVNDLLIVCGPMWAPAGVKTIQGAMGGFIATSSDGVTWSLAYSDPDNCIFRLA